jgi:hypothetical protein
MPAALYRFENSAGIEETLNTWFAAPAKDKEG